MSTAELLELLLKQQELGKLMVQGNGYSGIVKDLVISHMGIENDTVVILVEKYPN